MNEPGTGFPLTRLRAEGLPDCIVQAGTSAGRKHVGMTTFLFPANVISGMIVLFL